MQIEPIAKKFHYKDQNQDLNDLNYWLSQPVIKRAEAVTFLIHQSLEQGARLDKTKVVKRNLKDDLS